MHIRRNSKIEHFINLYSEISKYKHMLTYFTAKQWLFSEVVKTLVQKPSIEISKHTLCIFT